MNPESNDTQRDLNAASDTQTENAIEEMRAIPAYVDEFMADTGHDVHTLIAMLLDRGMPLRDRTACDDRHALKAQSAIDSISDAFAAWAKKRRTFTSPVERFIADHEADWADAA